MKFTKMIITLAVLVILFSLTGKTYGQFPEPDYIKVAVPVMLPPIPFARILPKDPEDEEIVLEREDNYSYNYGGQIKLVVYNNFHMQITAEIIPVGIKLADTYECKLTSALTPTDWGQSVSTLIGVHLFDDPGELTLQTRLTNVNMAKVVYQENLLDVAEIVITICPAQ